MKKIDYVQWLAAIVLMTTIDVAFAAIPDMGMKTHNRETAGFPFFLDLGERVTFAQNNAGANAYWNQTGRANTSGFRDNSTTRYLPNVHNFGHDNAKYEANFDSSGNPISWKSHTSLTNYGEIIGSSTAGTSRSAIHSHLPISANLKDAGTHGGFPTELSGRWADHNWGLTGRSRSENLWLMSLHWNIRDLDNESLRSKFDGLKKFHNCIPVTSVPIPGAVWLFGTSLMSLLAWRRCCKNSVISTAV